MNNKLGFRTIRSFSTLALVLVLFISGTGIGVAQIRLVKNYITEIDVVNIVPNNRSGETSQDSEPNLAVNPANTQNMAASAFTPSNGTCGANLAPIYVSTSGGNTWNLNCNIPSDGTGLTGDRKSVV